MRWIGGVVVAVALANGAAAQAPAPQPPALTLTATTVGCHWRYAYTGAGGGVSFDPGRTPCTKAAYCALGLDPNQAAAVPVGVPVRLVATSADKLRVLAVPPLRLQVDALPGKTSEATIEIKAEGLYPGRQGADCAGDPTAIAPALRALAQPAFDAWMRDKRRIR